MGSYNVKCQISGYTIGEEDSVVGFFLVPRDYQEDQSHRIDAPLKSMLQQWQPLHLPVKGHYGDFGRLVASNPGAAGVRRAATDLAGFDFSEDQWIELSEHGLYPDFLGASPQSKSPLRLWQVRADVYENAVKLGRQHSNALPSGDLDQLQYAFGNIDSKDPEYDEAVAFFNGLAALGYKIRFKPERVSQDCLRDHKRILPVKKKFLVSGQSETGPIATLSNGHIIRCALTDRPLSVNEPFYFLQLRASSLIESQAGVLKWPFDHEVSSHYQAHGAPIEAVINASGDVVTPQNPDSDLSGKDGIIAQLLSGAQRSRQVLAPMITSKSAFDTLVKTSPYFPIVRSDRAVMMDAINQLRDIVQREDLPALEDFFEAHHQGHIKDIVEEEGHSKAHGIPEYYLRSLHKVLESVESPGKNGPEFNAFARTLNVSSNAIFSAPVAHHIVRSMEAYITCAEEEFAQKDSALMKVMDIAEQTLAFGHALGHIGSGFFPTESARPTIAPEAVRDAWHTVHESACRSVSRDFQKIEADLSF